MDEFDTTALALPLTATAHGDPVYPATKWQPWTSATSPDALRAISAPKFFDEGVTPVVFSKNVHCSMVTVSAVYSE